MTVWRKVTGVTAGVFAAGLVIAAVEAVGHEAFAPRGAFTAAVAGYGLGALIGTMVTQRIADHQWALAIPVALGILAAINLFAMPHPVWFASAAAAALALGWVAGSRLAPRRAVGD